MPTILSQHENIMARSMLLLAICLPAMLGSYATLVYHCCTYRIDIWHETKDVPSWCMIVRRIKMRHCMVFVLCHVSK